MGKHILVVEDDDDSRNALCAILEALGHHPLAFASGKATLAALPGPRIDLAMLDVMMPEMNGYELLQKLREIEEFANTPMFMVTARNADSDMIEGYSLGADYYIPKPYTAKQISFGLSQFFSKKESGPSEP